MLNNLILIIFNMKKKIKLKDPLIQRGGGHGGEKRNMFHTII